MSAHTRLCVVSSCLIQPHFLFQRTFQSNASGRQIGRPRQTEGPAEGVPLHGSVGSDVLLRIFHQPGGGESHFKKRKERIRFDFRLPTTLSLIADRIDPIRRHIHRHGESIPLVSIRLPIGRVRRPFSGQHRPSRSHLGPGVPSGESPTTSTASTILERVLPVAQFLNAVILSTEAAFLYMPSIWIVFAVVLFEGLIAGSSYVSTVLRISEEVSAEKQRNRQKSQVAQRRASRRRQCVVARKKKLTE